MPRSRDNTRKEVRVDMGAISNRQARELLAAYRSLVDRIACDYPSADTDELRQVGGIAVLEAAATHDRGRGPTLEYWITKIVRWRVNDCASRELERLDRPADDTPAPEPLTNGRHDPERRFKLDQILELLPFLPPQQAVIIAGRLRGETFEQVGITLGISTQWAHTEYKSAEDQLRIWIHFGVT